MTDNRQVVERVFREESGRLIASLIRVLGDFDLDIEAGKAIALAPHQPAEVGIDTWRALAHAPRGRLADPALEKVFVEVLLSPGEAPRDDLRVWVVDRAAQRPVSPRTPPASANAAPSRRSTIRP